MRNETEGQLLVDEYLILTYTRNIMRQDMPEDERHVLLLDARDCINKAVGHDKQNVLDDELKNDTVQFDLAVERFKINSDYIDNRISDLMGSLTESLYDIENFCMDNESKSKLSGRFLDLFPNIRTEE